MAEPSVNAIAVWLAARCWDLDNPDGECARAIARPELFARLGPVDAAGAHHALTYSEVSRQLAHAPFDEIERHKFALIAGTWVVLGEEGRRSEISIEEASRRFFELDRWHFEVLIPARKRFAAAMREHPHREWFEKDRFPWEPAYTLGLFEEERGFFSTFEEDRPHLERGLAMNDQGLMEPREKYGQISFDTFIGYLDFLNTPEFSVFGHGPDGRTQVIPLLVKQRMDEIHRTLVDRKQVPLMEDLDAPDLGPGPLDFALDSEWRELTEATSVTRALRGRQDRVAECVQRHLPELLSGTMSIRALWKRSGISRKALQAAFDVECKRRRLA